MVCAKAATKAATKADHTLNRYYEDDMSSEEPVRSMVAITSSSKLARAGGSSKKTRAGERFAIVVSHEYVDHLQDSPLVAGPSPRVGVKEAFPFKLHQMLREATIEEFEEVVSWQPHGRAFRVHDRETFIRDIMPRFFQQTKITSFNRQLCLYGFVRLTAAGDDRGAYYHELCIRGRPDLLQRLHRTRVKGTGKKAASSPQTEPDFYSMPFCPEESLGRIGKVNHTPLRRPTATLHQPPND